MNISSAEHWQSIVEMHDNELQGELDQILSVPTTENCVPVIVQSLAKALQKRTGDFEKGKPLEDSIQEIVKRAVASIENRYPTSEFPALEKELLVKLLAEMERLNQTPERSMKVRQGRFDAAVAMHTRQNAGHVLLDIESLRRIHGIAPDGVATELG